MTKTIKAKYANGVITPLEPLNLPDDTVLLLTLTRCFKKSQTGTGCDDFRRFQRAHVHRRRTSSHRRLQPSFQL